MSCCSAAKSLWFFALCLVSKKLNDYYNFKLIIVSDEDTKTKISDDLFQAKLAKISVQIRNYASENKNQSIDVRIEPMINLTSASIPQATGYKRFMELSALTRFAGKLLTVDDKTCKILEIDEETYKLSTWFDVAKETGKNCGFEWFTVKDGFLFGGNWELNIKISPNKSFEELDWAKHFIGLKQALNVSGGYVTHEAISWNDRLKKWIIFPRKISPVPYDIDNKTIDAMASGNRMVVATEDFSSFESQEIYESAPSKGFSDVSLIKLGRSKGLITGKRVKQDIYFTTKTTEDETYGFSSFVSIIACEYLEQDASGEIGGPYIAFFGDYLCKQIHETQIPGDYKFEGIVPDIKC